MRNLVYGLLSLLVLLLAGCETPPRPDVPRPTVPGGRELTDNEIRMVGGFRPEAPDRAILLAAAILFEKEKPSSGFDSILDPQSPKVFDISPLVTSCWRYLRHNSEKLHLKRGSPEWDAAIREMRALLRTVGVEDYDRETVKPFKAQELAVQAFLEKVKEVNKRK